MCALRADNGRWGAGVFHLGRDTRVVGRGLVFPHPAAWSISRPEAIIDRHIWRREHKRKFYYGHFHVRHLIILTP